MTQYSYQELRKALDSAAQDRNGIEITGNSTSYWIYPELDDLQTIIDYLPEKPTERQEWDKKRSDAWIAVAEHPFFFKERRENGQQAVLEAVLEKLDELHRGPLPTEYGSLIKNVEVQTTRGFTEEYSFMQLSNVGWVGVTKDGVFSGNVSDKDITSWEPFDSE